MQDQHSQTTQTASHGPDLAPGPLLLASGSPRRRELLEEAGIWFEPVGSGLDDSELEMGDVTPAEWVMALAYLKARGGVQGAADMGMESVHALGADTMCVLGDRVIGQPADRAEARATLRSFVATDHEVVTGVALIDTQTGQRDLFYDRASVTWGMVSEEEIDRYLDTGAWQGKAGAYNLGERLEAGWPISYDGDPTTIVGLPMKKLLNRQGMSERHKGDAA